MSSTGMTTSTSERLADAGVDDRDRPLRAVVGMAAEEVGDLLERALRRREPDPLRRRVGDRLQPLEREHEVRAALGRCERVDLVDDHRVDVDERVPRRRREHQVEALRRGDEQVGRAADEALAILGRGVARAHRDRRRRVRHAEPLGGETDAEQRRAEVLLDVERQRAQRRDVEDPGPLLGVERRTVRRRRGQTVDRREERGERLAAAGGSADQRVRARR